MKSSSSKSAATIIEEPKIIRRKRHKVLSSLALAMNVYGLSEDTVYDPNADGFIILRISKVYDHIKSMFTSEHREPDQDHPVVESEQAVDVSYEKKPSPPLISAILSKFIEESRRYEDKSLCKNMIKITLSRNWLVARNFGYYSELLHGRTPEFVNATQVLIKLKKYLEMQLHRINTLSTLRRLNSFTPACHDKGVQCSKSTEFLKDSNETKFVSPSPRVVSREKMEFDYPQEYSSSCRKTLSCCRFDQPCHLSRTCEPSRHSLNLHRESNCPHSVARRESQILANVKRRMDEDFCSREHNSRNSSARSSYVTAFESLNSINPGCRDCEEEFVRASYPYNHCQYWYHQQHYHNPCCCNYERLEPIKSSMSCDLPSCTTTCGHKHTCVGGNKSCYSVDSGVDLPPRNQDSDDDHHGATRDQESQADLPKKTRSNETVFSTRVDVAVKNLTEDLILCERRARETFHRKKMGRSISPMSDQSSNCSTWNHLKSSKRPSDDELISGISTPSLVSLSDLEDSLSTS